MITIDLGTRAIATPALAPQVRDYFLGGRALGLYLLHTHITPRTTPRPRIP
jgi:aldehyde:ferredoxin oxidoreductase